MPISLQISCLRAPGTRLAKLMEVVEGSGGEWTPAEYRDILLHELNSPAEFELEALLADSPEPGRAARLKSFASFEQLFHSSDPPLELLLLTKDYAKAHLLRPETTLTKEIAAALYYASIAVAMTRCRTRITQLTDEQLAEGFRWFLQQAWLEPRICGLFERALKQLVSNGGEAAGLPR